MVELTLAQIITALQDKLNTVAQVTGYTAPEVDLTEVRGPLGFTVGDIRKVRDMLYELEVKDYQMALLDKDLRAARREISRLRKLAITALKLK